MSSIIFSVTLEDGTCIEVEGNDTQSVVADYYLARETYLKLLDRMDKTGNDDSETH